MPPHNGGPTIEANHAQAQCRERVLENVQVAVSSLRSQEIEGCGLFNQVAAVAYGTVARQGQAALCADQGFLHDREFKDAARKRKTIKSSITPRHARM